MPIGRNKRASLLVIFLTIFIDLVGFGIIIPLSPYLVRQFHASDTVTGLLMASYSIFQFLFSPFWGSLSDRIGRRPVLLTSSLGVACSYLLFAYSSSLPMLFVARSLAGAFGGNISAAHAYIADVTPAEERSKGMGLIGAAFGLGFIFGPLIGGLLGHYGQQLGSQPPFGISFSALGAAVICAGNFVFAFFALPESLPPEKRAQAKVGEERRHRLAHLWQYLHRAQLAPLIWVFFTGVLAMAAMEAVLFNFMSDRHGWDLRRSSYGFAYVGVVMVLTQGWLIRKWMRRLGEIKMLSFGQAAFAASLIAIPLSPNIAVLAVVMTVLALGNGAMRPPNLGLISQVTDPHEQGAVMGVTNSVSSLSRIIGPPIGGLLYQYGGSGVPFVVAGLVAFCGFFLFAHIQRRLSAAVRGAR